MNQSLPAPLDVKLMNLTASVLFLCCVLLLLAAGTRWVLRYPGFSVARIVVQGELVHNNAVTLRANVAPQLVGNFFTIDLRAARAAFEQAPWVRKALVRREFPRGLRVVLQEHDAVAYWGPDTGAALVNREGEVFEANVGDVEQEGLPRLMGPQGSSAEVLRMHGLLQPVFEPLGMAVEALELTGRGGWRATLDSNAVLELGGGTPQEVVERTQRFTRTLTQVAAQYRRRADALESADLRHAGGYALRLRGVTTVTAEAAAKTKK
ncbi:cell division protein FtsQ/DivIB [Acidovorax soli]|uniref:cell division protein FtsQ/DivIB n=1 Tax=Acidovorax TaxID=12916 RepID=UPI0026ED27B4|nr:cell division protein FtsQ/DivIB [Acidovorax soli]MCM2346707.1 cell division protein FtsQ/DivIB [Acidovorax soli]